MNPNPPEPTIPKDLKKIINTTPASVTAWKNLTPIARRDFVMWIESAKQEETRHRRLERVPSMLSSGKKRPCCFAVIPLSMYSALEANQKAKAAWKALSPTDKRDIVEWVEATWPKDRKKGSEEACKALAKGKIPRQS